MEQYTHQRRCSYEKRGSSESGEKRLTLLEQLKILEGPFTNAEEVQECLDNSEVDPKVKQAGMMKFARDSCTTLLRVDPLFNIRQP